GEGLVCCPCPVPCPCRSNARPPKGHCENTGVFRFERGNYGRVRMGGLLFASVRSSMETRSEPSLLILDQTASDEQLIALQRLYQSFNPLRPLVFANVVRAKISFLSSKEQKDYEVQIPKLLLIRIERQLGSHGEPLYPTAALDHFSNTIE